MESVAAQDGREETKASASSSALKLERVDGSTGNLENEHAPEEKTPESPGENLQEWEDMVGVQEKASQQEMEVYQSKFERNVIKNLTRSFPEKIGLDILLPCVDAGMNTITNDSFWKCFQSDTSRPWNWNAYLFPLWLIGLFLRYFVFFPIKFVVLLIATIVFAVIFAPTWFISNNKLRRKLQSFLIRSYSYVWLFCFTAVIRVHGIRPHRTTNQIFVANHTSLIDVVILISISTFGLLGQSHSGLVGLFEKFVFDCLSSIWFERTEVKDRSIVRQRLKEHIMNPENANLLVFPEGTCVNNGAYSTILKTIS